MSQEKLTTIFGLLILMINILFDLSHLAERMIQCFVIVIMITVILLMIWLSITTIKEIIKEIKNEK